MRLQSQGLSAPPPRPPLDLSKLALSTASGGANAITFRPSDLGVTACCREVFFTNNTSEVCVVGPRFNPITTSSLNPSALSSSELAACCAVEQTQQRTFHSTLDGLRKIARNEGITTLWRGLSPTLIMAIPANIIYFTGYDWLRYNPSSPIRTSDEYTPLVAGSVARVLAATAVSPIELFRTRLQAASGTTTATGRGGNGRGGHLTETFRGVKEMVAAHGYRALWRGLTLTLWRDVPFSGMYWWGYETIRGRLTDVRERAKMMSDGGDVVERGRGRSAGWGSKEERARERHRSQSRENHAETFADSFIAGAASGGFASVVTMPFDVGKTRTQVFRDSPASSASITTTTTTTSSTATAAATASKAAAAPEETNMARLLWHIFRTEGIPGLFRGWIPRTLRVAPSCAVMISSYEVGKRVFRGVNERALLAQVGGGEHEP